MVWSLNDSEIIIDKCETIALHPLMYTHHSYTLHSYEKFIYRYHNHYNT
jgi:hypothetical protein